MTRVLREITPEWDEIISAVEKKEFGRLEIIFQEGHPIRYDITQQVLLIKRLDKTEE